MDEVVGSSGLLRKILAAVVCVAPVLVHSQSFNCEKAHTPTEQEICRDADLKQLDTTLAHELKYAKALEPSRRLTLVSDERDWLLLRDKQCLGSQKVSADPPSACLAELYKARISQLAETSRKAASAASLAVCQKIVNRYKPLASVSSDGSLISALTKSPGAGVIITKETGVGIEADGSLAEWVKRNLKVALTEDLAQELLDAGAALPMGIGTLQHLPLTEFYVLNVEAGTAHCDSPVYFEIENGQARLADDPPGFSGADEEACMVYRTFGQVDGMPVYLQEVANGTPNLISELKAASWVGNRFAGACKVEVAYAPGFKTEAGGNWSDECEGKSCPALKHAAFELVESVQNDAVRAVTKAMSALSSEEQSEFKTAVKIVDARDQVPEETAPTADPGSILDTSPLHLPYVEEGKVFVASIGHFTVGWRQFAAWSVRFDAVENEKAVTKGQFGVAMFKKSITDVSITSMSQ